MLAAFRRVVLFARALRSGEEDVGDAELQA